MRTIIEKVHSNENGTLGSAANSGPFRLGLLHRPTSPPQFFNSPGNEPNVSSSQQESTTANKTVPDENRNTLSSSHPHPVHDDAPLGDADDSDPPHDSDNESDDFHLPTPRRLRAMFKRPRIPTQESTHWQRHVFRLVERNGQRYYDVRRDAVSS